MHSSAHARNAQNGFTLVEMAIVLAIVAFLVGSILTGKNMIRSSEIQATISKVQEYRGAVNKFTDRYLELPGDFTTASTYWPTAYDGDGNSHIGGDLNSACAGDYSEQWAAFEHMSKAELIDGQYNHDGGVVPNPGVNTPKTPIQGGGYTLRFCGDIAGQVSYFDGYYGHVIQVGNLRETGGGVSTGGTRGPLFTPDEAGAMDSKMDDGIPGTGSIKAPKQDDGSATNCTTTNDPATAKYNYANSGISCPLFFLMGF